MARVVPSTCHPCVVGSRRKPRLVVRAFGPNAYEPLERAIQIVNRVITLGEKAKWKGGSSSGSAEQRVGRERWVEFGAVTSAKVPVALSRVVEEETARLLQRYLSLPTSEYSLLDPQWVEREERDESSGEDIFTVKVPLQDIVGVDLTPTISIVATPHQGKGKVTFVGSNASLGSPGLDDAFRLSVVAVLNGKGTGSTSRSLPKIPNVPGRPVRRIKKWASRVAAKTGSRVDDEDQGDQDILVMADTVPDYTSSRLRHIYELNDDEDGVIDELEKEHSMELERASVPEYAALDDDPVTLVLTTANTDSNSSVYLQCRVNVKISIRVPSGLKVIPNPLLGYAGRLITTSVLHAVVPNFASLLGRDFEKWATNGMSRDGDQLKVENMVDIAEHTPSPIIE